jgi:hypothetical protein
MEDSMRADNVFAQELIDAFDAANIKWRSYSGRGMSGEYCVGVTCGKNVDEGEVLHAIRNVTAALRITRDSMGLGTICYWPRAKLADTNEGEFDPEPD